MPLNQLLPFACSFFSVVIYLLMYGNGAESVFSTLSNVFHDTAGFVIFYR